MLRLTRRRRIMRVTAQETGYLRAQSYDVYTLGLEDRPVLRRHYRYVAPR
jgi:hypothetical protein